MREMHDGIGSNLVSALTVARQQQHPANSVRTLERALFDLKLTVDSLEPMQGNVVALLGNFRHRVQPDLEDAGITCRWAVNDCQLVEWLDPTNALHLLRIFQEAVGNLMLHSEASSITIGCIEQLNSGQAGVLAFVEDDGRGFAPPFELTSGDAPRGHRQGGRGLFNMAARAKSMHARFTCSSQLGRGTKISVWLPYRRIVD